jgi:predicted Na+-dependent transporter
MSSVLAQLKEVGSAFIKRAKVRKSVLAILVVFFVLQLYFVRELLAAELIFGAVFAFVVVLVAVSYLLGSLGERGLELTEASARVIATSARRGFNVLGEMSKKSFRHPHSESAQ